MEVDGQSSSTYQEGVRMELVPISADLLSVGNQTNGEVSNKTSAVCKSTKDGEKSSDSDSECDATLVRSYSRSSHNLGSQHQKRKIVRVPYSLMSSTDKQVKIKTDRNRKKKVIRNLEQKLENKSNLSRQKRKKIKRHLKRLRPHNRGKHKKKATDTEADKEPNSQK